MDPAVDALATMVHPTVSNDGTTTISRVAGALTAGLLSGPVALLAFQLLAWRVTGTWPYYAHPDPKDLDYPLAYQSAGILLLVSLACVPPASLFLAWIAIRRPARGTRAALVVLLPLVAVVAWLWADPLGALEWYFD